MRFIRNNAVPLTIGGIVVLGLGALMAVHPREVPVSAVRPLSERTGPSRLEFPALNGGAWHLQDHRGKVVLMNFWASWCAPCRAETPTLIRLSEQYAAAGLVVAGVALDEGGPSAVRDFARESGISYPLLLPGSSVLASNISSLPTTVLFDRQGRAAASYIGEVRRAALEGDIRRLLSEP